MNDEFLNLISGRNTAQRLFTQQMLPIFTRSKAADYKDVKPGGLAGLLRMDSILARLIIFAAMSAMFFFFLRITSRKIPHGLVPDSTEDTTTALDERSSIVHPKP